jgi:ferrochelatase
LKRAATDGIAVVVVPIAFVSEHSETLVELDIEFKAVAKKLGVPDYRRTPAVGIHPAFVDGLAATVRRALDDKRRVASGCGNGGRRCPESFRRCPMEISMKDA